MTAFRLKLAVVILPIFLLASCMSLTTRYMNWHYVIPNQYQGFLAIWYDCPNGSPIPVKDGSLQIEFDDRGIFCTSESFVTTVSSSDTAETRDGQPIPLVDLVADNLESLSGLVMSGGDTLGIGGHSMNNPGNELTLSMFWVGDVQRALKVRKQTGTIYPDDEDAFLNDRLGLVPIQP